MKRYRHIFDRFLIIVSVVLIAAVAVVLVLQFRKNGSGAQANVLPDSTGQMQDNGFAEALLNRHLVPDQTMAPDENASSLSSSSSFSSSSTTTPATFSGSVPTTVYPMDPTAAVMPVERSADLFKTAGAANGWEACDEVFFAAARGGLHMRRKPALDAPSAGLLPYGARMRVTALSPGWAKIRLNDGSSAFVFREFIRETPPAPLTSTTVQKSASTANEWVSCSERCYVTARGGLRVRRDAAPTAPILRTAAYREALHVVARNAEWSRVDLPNGGTGYVSSEFLSAVQSPALTTTTTTAKTTTTKMTTTKTTTKSSSPTTATPTETTVLSSSVSETEADIHAGSVKLYAFDQFMRLGHVRWQGKSFRYYSQSVLPGYGLYIPGRHVNSDGYVADGDGYIVLAANAAYYPRGTVITTPFGYTGKVYDRFSLGLNEFDVYVK